MKSFAHLNCVLGVGQEAHFWTSLNKKLEISFKVDLPLEAHGSPNRKLSLERQNGRPNALVFFLSEQI